MASASTKTPETLAKISGTRWWLLVAAALYVASVAATVSPFRGDALFYISDALAVRAGTGHAESLWEFGHLLWRPLIYISSPFLLKLSPGGVAWSPNLKVLYGLIWIDRLAGFAAVLLMADLLRRVTRRPAGLMAAMLTMIWGAAFLGYAQAGGPYIPALALSVLALWWGVAGPGNKATKAVMAGVALAWAVAIWFPFVLIVPATACASLFFGEEESARGHYRWALLTAGSSGALLIAMFALGADLAGCTSLREFANWMQSSSHGWQQHQTVLRAVSGCARLFIELGSAGISLKRFVFKDPYNPVSVAELVLRALWQIALFWIFLLMIAIGASRSALGRRLLKLAAIAVLPTLFFALALFEPSSPERFLPILPFLLLALAAAWEAERGGARAARVVAMVFAALLPLMNGPTMLAGGAERNRTKASIEEFRRFAGPDDSLMTLILTDPLQSFSTLDPFDPVNLPTPVRTEQIVTAAMTYTGRWRQGFEKGVLQAWRRGAEVWVTKTALADRPPASTSWVEGDDPTVHWRDLPEFLRRLEYDRSTPGADGFMRVRHSALNEAALRMAMAQ
jgi:hypothetical protein